MMHRTGNSLVILLLVCLLAGSLPAFAKNPLAGYFSNLFDETRLEVDIGTMLWNSVKADYGDRLKVASSTELDALVTRLAPVSPRPNLPYQVIILDSPIPAEIPFPGGPILFTAGLVSMADTPEAREFLVARNICHCALRHPLMMLKKESLYARALKLLKRRPEQRPPEELRDLVRDYIKNVPNLDHLKADREALSLCLDPEKSRLAAIAFLQRWSQALLPIMPWDWLDLPARIQALEKFTTP